MAMQILVDSEGRDIEVYYDMEDADPSVGIMGPTITIYKILGDDCTTDLIDDFTDDEKRGFEEEIAEIEEGKSYDRGMDY